MPRQKKPTLKKRKDGRYKCVYNGRQFYGFTPEEAFAARDAFKAQQAEGFSQYTTVAEYSLPWLKRNYPAVRSVTYSGLAVHLEHLLETVGNFRLSEVVPSNIKQVYTDHYTGLSNSYVKAARQLYCSLFDSAVADGLIRSNPARDKTAKPHKGSKPAERILSQQERYWIENLCHDHRAFPVVMTMLYAGIRPQEAKAFNIDRDVDFINNIITIHQTAHIDPDNYLNYAFTDEGKTDNANRTIPLFPPLKEALQGKHGLLVTSATGEPVNKSTWRVLWRSYLSKMEESINGMLKRWYKNTKKHKAILAEAEALEKEGKIKEAEEKRKEIPPWITFDIVPYTLRHAFCCMCRDAQPQVDINTCRKWMGHADATMILKVYDSVSEDRSKQERKKIENGILKVQNEVQEKNTEPESIAK